MNRSELIERLARRFSELSHADAQAAVARLLEAMTDALTDGRRVEIRGFGSFSLKSRPPRLGRNPKTGALVMVPAKAVPHFKPGLALRERVAGRPASPTAD